jgi:hypothetical protein
MGGDVATSSGNGSPDLAGEPNHLTKRAAEHLAMRWSVTVCDLRLLLAIVLGSNGFRLILKCDRNTRTADRLD